MAATSFELISRAAGFALDVSEEAEAKITEELQTRADTSLVNGLRMLTTHNTIVAIGTVQAFEGLLQLQMGWAKPFATLDAKLKEIGRQDLVDRLTDYRLAVNVLKHGYGQSYETLLQRRERLPFIVKGKDENYFDEGDVSENVRLIDADRAFITGFLEVMNEVVQAFPELPAEG